MSNARPPIHIDQVGTFQRIATEHFGTDLYECVRPNPTGAPLRLVTVPTGDTISSALANRVRTTFRIVALAHRQMMARIEPRLRQLMHQMRLTPPDNLLQRAESMSLAEIFVCDPSGISITYNGHPLLRGARLNAELDADARPFELWIGG